MHDTVRPCGGTTVTVYMHASGFVLSLMSFMYSLERPGPLS